MAKTVEERLLAGRAINEQTGCWEWRGRRGVPARTYGIVMIDHRSYRVHRLAAELWLGFDPASDLCVLHRCDNPPCFNPDHLFIGTNAENMADKTAKGRQAKGEFISSRVPRKLDEEQVRAIRAAYRERHSLRTIAAEFGVSYETVRLIGNGTLWGWLDA